MKMVKKESISNPINYYLYIFRILVNILLNISFVVLFKEYKCIKLDSNKGSFQNVIPNLSN